MTALGEPNGHFLLGSVPEMSVPSFSSAAARSRVIDRTSIKAMDYRICSNSARELYYIGRPMNPDEPFKENPTMLAMLNLLSSPHSTGAEPEHAELRRRMQRPQRHRLLHGYPLAAATPHVADEERRDAIVPDFDTGRGILVGVLPHPFCNPQVSGCGFCTFPHEAFTSRKASEVIEHVVREIEQTLEARPALAGRPIAGLYFGGGTANLSPPEPFRASAVPWRGHSISRPRK